MQKLMKHLHKNEKGFTLVELMVVVVIIGILVAIAIPIYNVVTSRAETGAIEASLRTINGGIMMAMASEATQPADAAAMGAVGVLGKYIQNWTGQGATLGPSGVTYSVVGSAGGPYEAAATVPAGVGPNSTAGALTYRLVGGELVTP